MVNIGLKLSTGKSKLFYTPPLLICRFARGLYPCFEKARLILQNSATDGHRCSSEIFTFSLLPMTFEKGRVIADAQGVCEPS